MKKLKSILSTLAPALGVAVGGPLGGVAVKALAGALGAPEGSKPEHLLKALEEGTADVGKLQQADEAFALKYKVQLERLRVQDVQGARKMRIALDGDFTSAGLAWAAVMLVLFLAAGLFLLDWYGKEVGQPMVYLIGQVSGFAAAVYAFFYGSSSREHKNGDKS